MFLKKGNIISKIKISKVTDYAALSIFSHGFLAVSSIVRFLVSLSAHALRPFRMMSYISFEIYYKCEIIAYFKNGINWFIFRNEMGYHKSQELMRLPSSSKK